MSAAKPRDSGPVLVTTARMPFTVDEIRMLGEEGLTVYAADTFTTAPGNHSKHVAAYVVTPAPREEPVAYVDTLLETIDTYGIELVLPTFEESFYIARQRDRFRGAAELFIADFDTLARLHDKSRFIALARDLGMHLPASTVVTSKAELRAALDDYHEYFARPAFSRGGLDLLTNTGDLADALDPKTITPTKDNPWLVQEFVAGDDLCTYSVARHGQIVAHCTYVHPKSIDDAGGITFESIESAAALELSQRFVDALGYHGQVSFDFMATDAGLVPIECNPRATAGVTMMPSSMFVDALFEPPPPRPRVVPSGIKRKISAALIRDMVLNWRSIPSDLAALFSAGDDIYLHADDLLPGIYQLLSYSHVLDYKRRRRGDDSRSDLLAAYFHDVCWDGEPIL